MNQQGFELMHKGEHRSVVVYESSSESGGPLRSTANQRIRFAE